MQKNLSPSGKHPAIENSTQDEEKEREKKKEKKIIWPRHADDSQTLPWLVLMIKNDKVGPLPNPFGSTSPRREGDRGISHDLLTVYHTGNLGIHSVARGKSLRLYFSDL